MSLARLMARVSWRWCFAQVPVTRRGIILLRSVMYLLSFIPKNEYFRKRNMPVWLDDFIQKLADPEVFTQKIYRLTDATGYSRSQLARLFKKYTGLTLFEYLDNLKLNYALTLLQTGEESVLDIAMTLGYDSVSHFIKRFKAAFGITPQKLRILSRNNT